MNTRIANSPTFNNYWNVIKDWSDEMKEALITKLTDSVKNEAKTNNLKSWDKYFGSMSSDPHYPSSEEIDDLNKDINEDIEKFMV